MAYKQFQLDELQIKIYKHKSSRSLRLSVTHEGEVRVSIPVWAPYSSGLQFAASRRTWIERQLPAKATYLQGGQQVGKAHRIRFVPANTPKPTVRVSAGEILVKYPAGLDIGSRVVQQAASRGCVRALRSQAEQLLPQRLQVLAANHGFTYKSVSVKQLKSRWGSCDTHKNIVLNLYLMQLPWECIDYVLLHELTHTRVMQHGPRFWQAMNSVLPPTQTLRHQMRRYQPVLQTHTLAQATVA